MAGHGSNKLQNIYMKKKSFKCQACGYVSTTPQGIAAHVRFNHKDGSVDNKGRFTVQHIEKTLGPGTKIHSDTKTSITPNVKVKDDDIVDTMRYVTSIKVHPSSSVEEFYRKTVAENAAIKEENDRLRTLHNYNIRGPVPPQNGGLADACHNLVEQFEQVVREHEMIGSKDPADHAEIEREYKVTKRRLKLTIDLMKLRAVKGDILERELLS